MVFKADDVLFQMHMFEEFSFVSFSYVDYFISSWENY